MSASDSTRPDVIVTWLQNDYGQLGRAAESVAHALVDDGLARRVAYVEPPVQADGAGFSCRQVNGLDVYELSGTAAGPAAYASTVIEHSQLVDPILLNFGSSEANWWFHSGFAPRCKRTAHVSHDLLHLWPGLSDAEITTRLRVRDLLIRSSDRVIGLSIGSIDDLPAATYVGHGCDAGWLDATVDDLPEPSDLAQIPHPRALYFGALSVRIEVGALQALADSGVHVVLVGFSPAPAVARLIESHPNVHFLGSRPPSQSPAYLMHCDVGIVPHTDEPFTASMEPHKVYNYACAGLRSVTLQCATPPALSDLIFETWSVRSFVEATHTAIDKGNLVSLDVDFARTFTWGRVAAKILDAALD